MYIIITYMLLLYGMRLIKNNIYINKEANEWPKVKHR